MAETELPITGYLDRFSHRPGETFAARVSVRDGGAYRARLVRVLSGNEALSDAENYSWLLAQDIAAAKVWDNDSDARYDEL